MAGGLRPERAHRPPPSRAWITGRRSASVVDRDHPPRVESRHGPNDGARILRSAVQGTSARARTQDGLEATVGRPLACRGLPDTGHTGRHTDSRNVPICREVRTPYAPFSSASLSENPLVERFIRSGEDGKARILRTSLRTPKSARGTVRIGTVGRDVLARVGAPRPGLAGRPGRGAAAMRPRVLGRLFYLAWRQCPSGNSGSWTRGRAPQLDHHSCSSGLRVPQGCAEKLAPDVPPRDSLVPPSPLNMIRHTSSEGSTHEEHCQERR